LPGQSPPRDAPSPSPSEDPETEDMQMDEDEKPLSSNPQAALISPQDYIPFPTYNNPPNLYQVIYLILIFNCYLDIFCSFIFKYYGT
jgi:hypothetical protein